MNKRSKWEPRPLIDENPWSLLPNIGLSSQAAWSVQVVLLIIAAAVFAGFARGFEETVIAWLISAWSMRYMTQRLGGREAQFGVPRVSSESMFQERLLMDLTVTVVFALSFLVLLLGYDGWRKLLGGA